MAKKATINCHVDEALARRFRDVAKLYYGRLGMCISSAMLMFLEADPQVQGEYLRRVFDAEVRGEISAVIEAAKAEQLKRIKAREGGHVKSRS